MEPPFDLVGARARARNLGPWHWPYRFLFLERSFRSTTKTLGINPEVLHTSQPRFLGEPEDSIVHFLVTHRIVVLLYVRSTA